jgi:hypothetical protein
VHFQIPLSNSCIPVPKKPRLRKRAYLLPLPYMLGPDPNFQRLCDNLSHALSGSKPSEISIAELFEARHFDAHSSIGIWLAYGSIRYQGLLSQSSSSLPPIIPRIDFFRK